MKKRIFRIVVTPITMIEEIRTTRIVRIWRTTTEREGIPIELMDILLF